MIEVNNLTASFTGKSFLKKVAENVLKGENKKEIELSVALVGQARIRQLNKKYRGKNRVTDVLSFPDTDNGFGEIVICLSQVKKNSRIYKSAFEKELARVLIHGILHILGYEHEAGKKKADEMRKKEEHYLSETLNPKP